MNISPATIQGAALFVTGLATCWALAVRPVLKRLDRSREVYEALLGEKAIPELGKPERPGLFVTVGRLQEANVRIEETQAVQGAAIEVIRHEMQRNGGGSIKDEVSRLSGQVTEILARLGAPVA